MTYSIIRTVVFAMFSATGAVSGHGRDLSAIINKYAAWRGGATFEKLESIHQKGALQTGGLKGSEEVWANRNGLVRLDDDTGVLNQKQVVAAEHSWDTTPSGQVETLSVSDRHSAGRLQALQFAEAIRGRSGATVRLLGSELRAGLNWTVLRVSFGDEDTYDAFINPATGALAGFRIMEDRQGRFEGFDDWRLVDGVRMPFLHTTKTDAPGSNTIVTVASIELNRTLSPALFARPTPVRKAAFVKGASSTGWINFEFFSGNRIYLPAKVNGHDVLVLLDSGATVSSIDKTFAASIDLRPKGRFAGAGSGGMDTFGFIGGVEIRIGNLTLRDINVGAFDFAPVAKNIGHPLSFVLGNEVFNELAVDIDFHAHRIAFRDPATVAMPIGAVEVPLIRTKDRTVPVSIEGAAPVPFEFDLGDSSPLDVYPAYYKSRSLLDGRRTSQTIGGGVGGFRPQTVATLRHVGFAGVDFTQVPGNFTADIASADNSNLIFGSVGLPILARFQLIIDYSHDRLFATPSSDWGAVPFLKDRLGLYLTKKEATLVVKFVSPGSPAQAAGFKIGDAIRLIDQKPAEAWPENALRALRDGDIGTAVGFVMDDGGIKQIELADFF